MRRFCRPFFSILVTATGPISAVDRTWVPPQGCRSTDPSTPIATSRTLPVPRRRLDAHGADEAGIVSKLLVGDPAKAHRMIRRDKRKKLLGQVILVDYTCLADVEIEPAFLGADRPAGYWKRDERTEKVERRVHAHVAVASLPAISARTGRPTAGSWPPAAGTCTIPTLSSP